jgi:hypothetical protein
MSNLLIEIGENTSATSTVLSETVISICIFYLIFKTSRKSLNPIVKQMLVKVLLTMVLMWLLDIIVIYLEYSGRQTYAYLTKPTVISFKFYIELLILGYCKKQLFILSGIDNW